MEQSELQVHMNELSQKIAMLPPGSIVKKTVTGREYYYHRWTENKKRHEKYIPAEALDSFRTQIEQRKELEQELKALKKMLPKTAPTHVATFTTNVRIGTALRTFSASVKRYKKRECFQQLHNFLYGEAQDKVFILYGLRRTGKTTMIRQALAEMNDTALMKSAFIQITAQDTLATLNTDLKVLESQGFQYVFLDEVTLLDDFILSLRIAMRGYKIAYSKEAYALESASLNMREEEKRKVRISAGGLQSVWRLRGLLNMFRYGILSFQYISHRVLRWTLTPVVLFALLPLNLLLACTGHTLYTVILALQLAFYLMGYLGYKMEQRNLRNKLLFIPYYFLFMNINVIRGYSYLAKHKGTGAWEKAKRGAG